MILGNDFIVMPRTFRRSSLIATSREERNERVHDRQNGREEGAYYIRDLGFARLEIYPDHAVRANHGQNQERIADDFAYRHRRRLACFCLSLTHHEQFVRHFQELYHRSGEEIFLGQNKKYEARIKRSCAGLRKKASRAIRRSRNFEQHGIPYPPRSELRLVLFRYRSIQKSNEPYSARDKEWFPTDSLT